MAGRRAPKTPTTAVCCPVFFFAQHQLTGIDDQDDNGHQGMRSAVRDALEKAFVGGSEGQLELAIEKPMAAKWN